MHKTVCNEQLEIYLGPGDTTLVLAVHERADRHPKSLLLVTLHRTFNTVQHEATVTTAGTGSC